MKKVGLVGLGDMGMGMAKNILKHGFDLTGFDLRPERLQQLSESGGKPAANCREVGEHADYVFVMVLNGAQAHEVIFGKDGLLEGLASGAVILVSATIHPAEMREIERNLADRTIHLVDTPVSGGQSGADNGTLTMMVAAKAEVFEDCKPVLDAVGQQIFHVGDHVGMGQTVKAAHQALCGAVMTATFEAFVLGVKAGADPEALSKVIGAGAAGNHLSRVAMQSIMERKFTGTGSHIGTMYKDLGISMAMAKENGVPMFTTSAAYELFQSGKSLFPHEDNWSVAKLLEQIAGITINKTSREHAQ